MTKGILAILIIHAVVLLGNTPTPGSPSQNSKKDAQANQAPASQPPTAQDQIGSGHNGKPDQPEAAADNPPEPHVTINAVPRIDVKRDWLDYATLIVGILLIVVGAATGAIIGYQAVQTKVAAQAARLNARALMNAERAWMSVAPVQLNPAFGAGDANNPQYRLAVGMNISNTGRTPARILRSTLLYAWTDNSWPLPFTPVYLPEEITIHSGLLLMPNSQPIAHIAFLKPFDVLTVEQVEAVKDRKAFVYAYGFVEYRDVFDEKVVHETRFCYVYNFPQPGEPQFLKGLMPGGPEGYNKAT